MDQYKIDDIGMQILEIMSKDSRSSAADIARQLNTEESLIVKRIKKYEKDKIILRYKTVINWARIKNHEVRALIEVKITPERGTGFDAVAESIYNFPEVAAVYLLSGGYDLLVEVDGSNLQDVASFISEKLSTLKNVQSTQTHFLLKKYKEDGQLLIPQGEDKRLPFTP